MTDRNRARTVAFLGGPLLALLLVFLVWPVLNIAAESVGAPEGFDLGQYAAVLTNERYLKSIAFTALLAVVSTLLALVLCVPAGLYLQNRRTPLARALAVALTVPLSLPGIVIGFFIILMVGNTGVIPLAFEAALGERHLQIAYTSTGLLLGYLYFQIPRVVLVVRGAAATVRPDSVIAARSLGATTGAVYRKIVIPTLRPALMSASALALATAFGAFGTAATLTRGQRVIPLEVASAFTESFQPRLAATLSVILAVLTTAILVGVGRLAEPRRPRQASSMTTAETIPR